MQRNKLLLGLLALVLAALIFMQWWLPAGLQCFVANYDVTLLDRWKCPGIALLEIDAERQVQFASYGYETPALQRHIDAHTRFNIASLAKQFTGMALGILMSRGQVELDAPVARYVKDFTKPEITVAQLVYHTAGLPDYLDLCLERSSVSNADVLAFANAAPLEFPPGTSFSYSNTGYALLATLVERVTGQDFAAWMQANVFVPLKMRETAFQAQSAGAMAEAFFRPKENPPSCDAVVGDGGIVTSASDYAKWLLEVSRPSLVPPKTMQLMLTPGKLASGQSTEYAFGWDVTSAEIQHEGAWAGYESIAVFDEDYKTWDAAFTNYVGYNLSRIIDRFWLRHAS